MNQAFSTLISTVNGSGSQSANAILAKALFRMGHYVGAKNLFPSNIAGLPTWFVIRTHPDGFVSREKLSDIVVAKNSETAAEDLQRVKPGGFYFYDQEIKINPREIRSDINSYAIPFREIVQSASDSIKMRKLLTNMVYVGVLAELLKLDSEILSACLTSQFSGKESVVAANATATQLGRAYAKEHLSQIQFPFTAKLNPQLNANKILIDGNSAAALGATVGGCTFFSWYPITPSTSLAETFHDFCEQFRVNADGSKKFAVLQAEDELSAINMVIGAGWAGSRAMTATSGPGLSLMAEAAGLSYFAEIPAVIWDVQRAGPSTGLPTRTLQGDLRAAANLSHGDTEHIVLLPANPEECYEFAQLALDLAEKYQTLVIVLSDLDIGMNFSISNELQLPSGEYQRGKVLSAEDLNHVDEFARYKDVDNDGIPQRTLPGTLHTKAAYFTRGTGHNEKAGYTEDPLVFKNLLLRLKKKFELLSADLPKPLIHADPLAKIALVSFGSTDAVIPELQSRMKKNNIATSTARVRALPLKKHSASELESFLNAHEKILILEQNRDAQMHNILVKEFPHLAGRFHSALTFDGWPISIDEVEALVSTHAKEQVKTC